MKNPVVPIIIILLILGLGAGYFFMKNNTSKPSVQNTTETKTPQGQATMKTLKELMSAGQDQKCTFTNTQNTGTLSGTTYLSKGKVRGDMEVKTSNGATTRSHMITDGKYFYNWSDEQKQGMKMEITEDMNQQLEEAKEKPESYKQYLDENQQMNYECSGWRADASLFVPPTDVTFTDFSEQLKMMQKLQENSSESASGMPENKCDVCNSLPADAQAACKQGLGCN